MKTLVVLGGIAALIYWYEKSKTSGTQANGQGTLNPSAVSQVTTSLQSQDSVPGDLAFIV